MGADALAPWHIILLVIVLVVLFGAKRLPGAARSLGQSMHIFKESVSGLHPEDDPANPASNGFSANAAPTGMPPAAQLPPPADATQAQLLDLQRQVAELQKQSASGDAGQSSQPF